jgi:ribosomal protein S18 acetylase RimI-like enzyme
MAQRRAPGIQEGVEAGVEAAMRGETILRRAAEPDAPAILALTRAAYAKWVPVIGREPLPMRADYSDILRNDRVDLLYVGSVLGALIHTIRKPDHLEIYNVAVAPGFQGRGLGRRLLEHAEMLATSLGYDEVRLFTNKAFAENIEIYLRVGYEIYREEPFMGGFTV